MVQSISNWRSLYDLGRARFELDVEKHARYFRRPRT